MKTCVRCNINLYNFNQYDGVTICQDCYRKLRIAYQELENKLINRNKQIADLKHRLEEAEKVITLSKAWCVNSAKGMSIFDKSHPNYKLIQEQIKIYNQTLEAITDFETNPQQYSNC